MSFSKKVLGGVVAASALATPVALAAPAHASTVSKAPAAVKQWDKRCMTGRSICIDKKGRSLAWVVDGKVQKVMPVRTGRPGLETRSGVFKVYWKHKNHYSTLYHVSMPYSQFFSGGQAVHYSAEFATKGYMKGSHGCVNLKSKADAAWLFSQTRQGDKVVVY